MSVAIVGTPGAVVVGAAVNTAISPLYGTGESHTAGDLGILWLIGFGNNSGPGSIANWTQMQLVNGGTTMKVGCYYRNLDGSANDLPTVPAVASQLWVGMIAEFSSQAGNPVGQVQNAAGTSGSNQCTVANPDAATGFLNVVVGAALYSAGAAETTSHTLTNATYVDAGNNDATSTTNHYRFGYGITTANASADRDTFAYTTTNITQAEVTIATFLPAGLAGPPRTLVGVGV